MRPAESRAGNRIWSKRERRWATGASQNIGHSPLQACILDSPLRVIVAATSHHWRQTMNLAHLLQRRALEHPQRPAIFSGTQCVATHDEWALRSARVGAHILAAGLVPGDRVLLFMRNHPRYLELMFGAWWAGLVVVPVNAKLHLKEVQWIVDNSAARWAFVTSDVAPDPAALTGLDGVIDAESATCTAWLEAGAGMPAITERHADDTAWLFYTSGTTGRPKGVMITHRNLMTMGLTYFNDVDHVDPGDAIAYAAPMSHGAGLYAIPHLMAGARHVVPASGGFEAAELFALGRQIGSLSLFAAPTIVKRIVDEAEAQGLSPEQCGESFKTIVYGGAPMYAADIQRALRVMGPRFVQIYGQGESPMVGTALSRTHLADASHPRHAPRPAPPGAAPTPGRLPRPRHTRRLALDRRHGHARRRRLLDPQRPQQGPHHQRRQQHLPARGGRGA